MRPSTASERPSTSRPATSVGPAVYSDYYDDVDDDESSDDGDVFAFLPPATPEPQHPLQGSQPAPSTTETYSSPLSSPPVTVPAASYPFDPYSRFPSEAPGMAGNFAYHQPVSQPLTPPSTASHSGTATDSAIRMTRLGQTPQSSVEVRVSLPSGGETPISEKDQESILQRRLHTKSDSRGSTSMGGSFIDGEYEDGEGREASIK